MWIRGWLFSDCVARISKSIRQLKCCAVFSCAAEDMNSLPTSAFSVFPAIETLSSQISNLSNQSALSKTLITTSPIPSPLAPSIRHPPSPIPPDWTPMSKQSKISSFFLCRSEPPPPSTSPSPDPISPSVTPLSTVDVRSKDGNESGSTSTKVVNKKRSYAQYHLELGQPDFLLHHCAVCGMSYARGDTEDEKSHKSYHKEFCEGIAFKGWKNEKVVARFCDNNDRIVLVEDADLSGHKQKIRQVIRTTEKELGFGEGQLLHAHCKVYLYILSHRIAGCLVAEPIKAAHRVISETSDCPSLSEDKIASPNKTMTFGNFNFTREVLRKCNPSNKKVKESNLNSGAIVCEEESVPAVLGFRAIWVAPSRRRTGVASRLMDAARKSCCPGGTVEACKCAFTPPTSAGKALACKYSKTTSFLVYRTVDW